ncbi:unnamed protein product [Enterobius vermicularis]|uniref:Uncharacterized protein n=1 Tax=Enterobius vermicularis TaxID=51028 RepID=A0A0N4UYV4_ENTVE|nr:unnamed protein product [Enterobius vermicularis]
MRSLLIFCLFLKGVYVEDRDSEKWFRTGLSTSIGNNRLITASNLKEPQFYANSSPGPSSPTPYASSYASLPNHSRIPRLQKNTGKGRELPREKLACAVGDLDSTSVANYKAGSDLRTSHGSRDDESSAVSKSGRRVTSRGLSQNKTAFTRLTVGGKESLPCFIDNSSRKEGPVREFLVKEIAGPHFFGGHFHEPHHKTCKRSANQQCFCHYGGGEPKIDVIVRSNRKEMERINWSEIPLHISFDE